MRTTRGARVRGGVGRSDFGGPAFGFGRWHGRESGSESVSTMSNRKNRARSAHESSGFVCVNCGLGVPGVSFGTKHRNHCPACLWSRHVDESIGDRLSVCRGGMEPIAVAVRGEGEWCVVHRCVNCGQLRTNRIAGDDSERALLQLALRPLASPAFPLTDWR